MVPTNAYQWRWWRQQGHRAINRDRGQESVQALISIISIRATKGHWNWREKEKKKGKEKKRTRSSYNSACHPSQGTTEVVIHDFNVLCQDPGEIWLYTRMAYAWTSLLGSLTNETHPQATPRASAKMPWRRCIHLACRRFVDVPKARTNEGRTKQFYH